MKIVQLTAENVKRLKAVSITPDGSLVQITGRNAQGKSSVLDSIAMALGGATQIPDKPVRHGMEKAKVVCKLEGGIVVRRTLTANGGGTLTVENEDGSKYASPQAVLDKLIGRLTLDPLAFTRMPPKQQAETLRGLTGLDFTDLERQREKLYAERTDVNRERAKLEAQIAAVRSHSDVPKQEISVSELASEFTRRQQVNSANREMRLAIGELHRSVAQADKLMQSASEQEKAATTEFAASMEAADDQLERDMERLRAEHARKKDSLKTAHDRAVAAIQRGWSDAQKLKQMSESKMGEYKLRLEAAVDLDVEDIRRQMSQAESVNEKVRANNRRADLQDRLSDETTLSETITRKIDEIDAKKRAALASAKFPVPGLSFDQGGVTLNGIPFSQASAAEQLRISAAMGLAMNPKLRVLLIRDGSLLDADGLKVLAEFAELNDAQIWIERVADGSKVGVVIEDGCCEASEVLQEQMV